MGLKLYRQVEDLLLDDVAVTPPDHGVTDVLVKPCLEGFVATPIDVTILPLVTARR